LAADSNLKPVATELGGKSPQIVLGGCRDLDAVAAAVAQSIFWNSGQVCTAGSRLLVHEVLHDPLLELVVQHAADFVPGDPLDPTTTLGPLASAEQLACVEGFVQRNPAGRLVCGGRRAERVGFYFPPTIVDGVAPDSELFREEVFGPVLAVATFSTFDEAVRLANATSYGLSATAWTDDLHEAVSIARRVRAGFVTVNPHRPSGAGLNGGGEPFGQSGSGVEGGLRGVHTYQRVKLATIGVGAPDTV
jgi:acyl-CoA reductase-like NAD-dependent aldehyde dehydrogenase